MAQKSRTRSPSRPPAGGRRPGWHDPGLELPRAIVLSLEARRRRRGAPTIHLGRHTYRVLNPRLWTLARWIAQGGWRAWIYETDG
jgi:hypothetical protein